MLLSKEEAQHLATDVLPPGFFVVHDASRSGKNDEAELTRRQEVVAPLFHIVNLDVEAWGDDTALHNMRK